jgi:hypothetical protein
MTRHARCSEELWESAVVDAVLSDSCDSVSPALLKEIEFFGQ